jgi:putative membrane protein
VIRKPAPRFKRERTRNEAGEWSIAMMNGWDMTGWGWVWMSVMTVVGVMLVGLIALALLRVGRSEPPSRQSDDPMAILAQRFARGEIDEPEYRRRKSALQPSGGSPVSK